MNTDGATAGKPPYRVPFMGEIGVIPDNGLRLVSTFSGCGGSCLGFRMAGFRTLWASEFVPAAREVYELNHPGVPVDGRDIRNVGADEILEVAGVARGELDVLEGSPPCASFSSVGKKAAGWGKIKKYSDTKQRTDDLFFEFARILRGIMPKVFVAENVSGLARGVSKGYFKAILRTLKDCGYVVTVRMLDAQWLGVPQSRQRLIFVGVRDDLEAVPVHPSPLGWRYSVKDVLPHIVKAEEDTGGQWSMGEITNRPAPTVRQGGVGHLKVVEETSIEGTVIGSEYDKLEIGKWHKRYFNLQRPDENKPCPAILSSHGGRGVAGIVHPTEKRKFTIAELKRICAFPDDFELTGSYAQQWERLGRAVPPVMMFHVARTIRDEIFLGPEGRKWKHDPKCLTAGSS